MKLTFLILLCLASCAFAERPWPKPVAGSEFAKTGTATLPKALRDALLGCDEFEQGTGKLPDSLDVCRIDLKGDGAGEFIVQSNQDYSGGPVMYVFEHRKAKFACIASFSGVIYFAARSNGYFQIVTRSRGGARLSVRELYRYRQGRYHLVRITDYQVRENGVGFDFVRERNPKEFDN